MHLAGGLRDAAVRVISFYVEILPHTILDSRLASYMLSESVKVLESTIDAQLKEPACCLMTEVWLLFP